MDEISYLQEIYVSNKISIDTNTHKTRIFIDLLVKM
jgi:hypothetical protein